MTDDEYMKAMQERQTEQLRQMLQASPEPLDQQTLRTDPKFAETTRGTYQEGPQQVGLGLQAPQGMPPGTPMDFGTTARVSQQSSQLPYYRGPGGKILQAMGYTTPVSPLAEHMAGQMYPGVNLTDSEKRRLGDYALHPDTLKQRQALALELSKQADAQRKEQMGEAFKVFLDHNTPWAARSKALEQMGHPYATSLARIGSEQIASNFSLAYPYLSNDFKQQWEKDPNSIPPAVVEAHLKDAMDRGKQDHQFQLENARLEDIRTRVQNNQPVTLKEAATLEKHLTEQAELPVKLKLLREQLSKAQADTKTAQNKPSEAYSARGPNGDIITGVYDPRTGQTTEKVGAPLQKVENIIPTNMMKDRAEIRTSIDQLKTTADLFHPDFVGTYDATKNAVLRALHMPVTATRVDPKTGKPTTVREEDFRFAYDMLQKVLRKTLMGTAQSAQELSANPLAFPSATDRDADVTVPAFLRGQYRNLVQQLEAQDKVLNERMRQSPMTFAQRYQQLKQMAATTDSAGRNALGFKSGEDMNTAIAERLAEEVQRGWIAQ